MALNKSDRCSTCLRKCYVTTGQNPVQMSCGHHTCFRCHQTQWLTSERNDSEESNCIKCTLAVLNNQSNDIQDVLKRHPELFRSANCRAEISGVREPNTLVDNAEKIRSYTAKEDTCSSEACLQYYRGVQHHRSRSSPANLFPAAPELERNSALSHESFKDTTRRNKDLKCNREPNDEIYKVKGMSSHRGDVLRFTPVDPIQKYEHSNKEHMNNTREKVPSPEKFSKESSESVIKKAKAHVKRPSDSEPTMQTYSKTYTHLPTLVHKPTHGQYSHVGQNEVDPAIIRENGSLSSGRSHHKHKSSHKKSKKKKKHSEKNRTKSSQDSSLHVTGTPDGKTKTKEKQSEASPQPCHLKTASTVCKVEIGDILSINGNNKNDSSTVSGSSGKDMSSVVKSGQQEKLSFGGKEDDKLFIAAYYDNKLSLTEFSEGDLSVVENAASKSGNGQQNKIVENNEEDRLPYVENNEGGTLSIAVNDDSESTGVVPSSSPITSLDACASSTRFSSPMSLDDYQLNNILAGSGISELEVQDWSDSDVDKTELEIRNRRDSKEKDIGFMAHKESYPPTFLHDTLLTKEPGSFMESYQPCCDTSDLLHCTEKENLGTQVKQEVIETSSDKMPLDDSILDRSGILYYDPIDDSDEDRLVIVSLPTSEVSLTGEDTTITKPKETSSAESKADQSSAANDSAPEKNPHLGKSEDDHDQLLQSYQKYLMEKSNEFADACNDESRNTQENDFVRGFQESYTTSLVCSQMATKALKRIKESGEYQKGPYQLSAKMLTGVLNILVQQANLASTICSELLNSTEIKQTKLLSNTTGASYRFQETLADQERSFGAETKVTKDLTSGNMRDTSDPSTNACCLNRSAPSCSTFEKYSAEENNVMTVSCVPGKEKDMDDSVIKASPECSAKMPTQETPVDSKNHISKINFSTDIKASPKPRSQNRSRTPDTAISKSTDKSDKGKCSKELFVNYDNLDTKQQVVRKESRAHSNETTTCVHQGKSVATKDAGSWGKCGHKNIHEQINIHAHSFVHNQTQDLPCSEHEMERNKVTDDEKCSFIIGMSDLPIVCVQDNVNDVVADNALILNDMVSVEKKTPDLSVEGVKQASMGTQVTERELETAGLKLDKQNIKLSVVEKDKHFARGKGKNITHPGKSKDKDKDRETRNSTNSKPKQSKEKRNLFDSIFELEESVVESPCKYRKLQFGKLPQSHTEDSTQVDTPGYGHGKGSQGPNDTTSLSNQKCKDGTKPSRQGSGSTKKSNGSHHLASTNKKAENISVVSSSSTPTTETKQESTATVKSSTKRSSSVPSAHHNKERKDRSKSRSRYHSSCGTSENDSSITHRRSSSYHRNSSSHRNSQRSSERKAITDRKAQGSASVVIHGSKRDICIQTEAQVVCQTPSKSEDKLHVEKGDTMSQFHKATGDVLCFVKEGIGQEKVKESEHMTDSKYKKDVIADQSLSINNDSKEHDIKDDILESRSQVDMQHSGNCPYSLPTGYPQECLRLDSESTNSMAGKPCYAERATDLITSKVEKCSEDHFEPVSCYSNYTRTTVLDVEEDAYPFTPHDEIYTQRSLARDEEIFRCLSFSDSDDDVPLAQIVETLRASQRKSTSTADSVNKWEDDDLPKLAVPIPSKYWKQHGHRRSRCDRPGLKTYLEIRNALPDTSTDQCSETPETTWRNSLMPPPLEAVKRSKSREKVSQSTPTNSQASSATATIPPRSEDISGNQSSESAHESDLEPANNCDGEGENGDSGERGGSSKKKKKRHRRKKSDKPVVSSSSEECIPKGRKRGFQWRQECLRILDRVYNHEFSDPFRHEVKSKDIPDYYKIVKRGMCFDIIGYKLRCNIYEELRDFFLDIRLVFDNCRLYHKPESPIYQAGLVVKCFFRKVAKEILMPRTTARSRHPI